MKLNMNSNEYIELRKKVEESLNNADTSVLLHINDFGLKGTFKYTNISKLCNSIDDFLDIQDFIYGYFNVKDEQIEIKTLELEGNTYVLKELKLEKSDIKNQKDFFKAFDKFLEDTGIDFKMQKGTGWKSYITPLLKMYMFERQNNTLKKINARIFFNYDRIGNIINMEKLYQMRYEDDLKKLTSSTASKNMPDIDTGLDKPLKLDLANYNTYKDMVKVDKGLKALWNNDETYLKDKAAFLIRVEDNLGIKVCNIFNQLMLNNIDFEISMMRNKDIIKKQSIIKSKKEKSL